KDYGDPNGTNLEAGVRLAMAVLTQQAANRLVLISDANQTAGSLMAAAQAAKAARIEAKAKAASPGAPASQPKKGKK
ncbi:MAG: hypothetical protein ACK4FR_13700, partial [Tabrizicola sp.]